MEAKRNSESRESTNLELVLEQFANEQKSQTKSLNELVLAINSLSEHIIHFEERIHKSTPISVSANTMAIQEMVKNTFTEMHSIVDTQQQKPVLKKCQLLLFPEQDAKMFYKIVFGRWFLWLAIMLLLTNLYKFGVHWSDNEKEIQIQLLENNRIKYSWHYLYSNGDRGLKKLMDTIYSKTYIIEH
jgi:hypothetical protein